MIRQTHATPLLVIAVLVLCCAPSCTRKKKDDFSILKKTPAATPSLVWQEQVDGPGRSARAAYLRALTLEGQKRYRAADDLLESLNGKYPLLNDFVLYRQATIAKRTPDEGRVMRRLKKLLEQFPRSPLAPAAAYELARSALRANEKEAALRYFEETRKAFPDSPQATGALYYLAELAGPSDAKKSAALLREYLKRAPSGTFALDAAKGLCALPGGVATTSDRKLAGLACYHARDYARALPLLEKAVDRDTWYPLALCRMRTGAGSSAAQTFGQGLRMGGEEEDIHQAMRYLAAMSGLPKRAAWEEMGRRYPAYGDFALYNRTLPLTAAAALPLFNKILAGWPKGSYAPEASWNIIWAHVRAGRLDVAYKLGFDHLSSYPTSRSAPAVLFWMAKILERKSQPSDAAKLYGRVVKEYGDSYYAFRARGRLAQIEDGADDPRWTPAVSDRHYPSRWSPPPPLKLAEIAQRYGPSLAEVMALGSWKDARSALEGRDDPLMEAYIKENEEIFDEALVLLRDRAAAEMKEPASDVPAWQLLYPMPHCGKVKARAGQFGVDPFLVQAIAREESYFNRKARSSADAMGLMQLLPGTGRDAARWISLQKFTPDMLFNADINIALGSRYLKSVLDFSGGAALFAVASYNAGPGAVQRWRSSLPTDDLDVFVECIPYDQTRDYVKKVFRSWYNYTRIYAAPS